MDKRAQEAQKWLEQIPYWEPEVREQAARRFFQVWNALKGEGKRQRANKFIKANVPLRCTVWRSSVRKWDDILADLVFSDSNGLVASYTQGLEEVYPELQARAEGDPAMQNVLQNVDALLGKGEYKHRGLADELKQQYEESLQRERTRKSSPAEEVVKEFYSGLARFPVLQRKFLESVVDARYLDIEGKLGKGAGPYHTGTSKIGGVMRPNKLLTFFLMQDPYPYLQSRPTDNMKEVAEKYPHGNTPETALDGIPISGGKKVWDELSSYSLPNGSDLYVRNQRNPEYDFITISPMQSTKQAETKRMLQDKVLDLHKQSLFGEAYLAKNVFEQSEGFEDKEEMPGVSVLMLGREGEGFDIADEERDVTKLENGGLFWVPEKGLPGEPPGSSKDEKKPGQPKKEGPPEFSFKQSLLRQRSTSLPPSKNLFAQSLLEVFAQELGMPDVWIDDEGNIYDSMDDLLDSYDNESWEKYWNEQAREHMTQMLHADLSTAEAAQPEAWQMPEEEEEEEAPEEMEEVQPWSWQQGQEVPEVAEPLPLAAKQVIKLVRVANALDRKGLNEEANKVDGVVRDIIQRLLNS